MKFREALRTIDGLRRVADQLPVLSAPGRSVLMETEMMTDRSLLDSIYRNTGLAIEFLRDKGNVKKKNEIESILRETRDISLTLKRLDAGEIPDEVELFEIKGLALAAVSLSHALIGTGLDEIGEIKMPDAGKPAEILDPEQTGNTHFHIYDAYSPRLSSIRKELKALHAAETYDEETSARLTAQCLRIEEEIRERLGERLRPYARTLQQALEAAGCLDLLLARAAMAINLSLSAPETADLETQYEDLRYLPVEILLREGGKEFQPVSITLRPGVTMITGANMGGKTITLKSVGLAQAMAQYGFYVAARRARIKLVEEILTSMGDPQTETEGLSSFGAEILRLDAIIEKAKRGTACLILIDEPARTTNPEEGAAIAGAVAEMLDATPSVTLITTHYGNIDARCRRLKVKGLHTEALRGIPPSPGNLGEMMDYSLVEAVDGEPDREALTIARLIGIDKEFAKKIETKIK